MTGRSLVAEFLGTALLLVAIVGSGITAATGGDPAGQLFQHALVVGAALAALIMALGPVSGGHFNPAVTLVDAVFGGLRPRTALWYATAQTAGAVLGTASANVLFGQPGMTAAATARTGTALLLSETVATFGLLVVIFGVVAAGAVRTVPAAVGTYIAAAIYATPSAAFANPAVTVARALTDTYTGIAPDDVAPFVAAQTVGAVAAAVVIRWLFRPGPADAAQVVVPHSAALGARAEPRHGTPSELAAPFPPAAGARAEPRHGTASEPAPFPPAVRAGADLEGEDMTEPPMVLFLCVRNAGRSQMAAGWLRHLAGDRVTVASAGSDPGDEVHPVAAAAMREVGIDITGGRPRRWTDELLDRTDVVVTMGCGDACPVLPGVRYVDWPLDDPAGRPLAAVRPIRDAIEQRVRMLMDELGVRPVRGS